jgi:hypothetical protein
MVGRDLWKELQMFHSDLATGKYPATATEQEILLQRALRLLQDIYRYEHTAEYN